MHKATTHTKRPKVKCSNYVQILVVAVQSMALSPWNRAHYAGILSISFSAGVCLGMQLAVCEFARNVLGWKGE